MPNDGWRSNNANSRVVAPGYEGSQPDLRKSVMEEDAQNSKRRASAALSRLTNELARRDTCTTKHADLKCRRARHHDAVTPIWQPLSKCACDKVTRSRQLRVRWCVIGVPKR